MSKKTYQIAKSKQNVKEDILESKEQTRCQRRHTREQRAHKMSKKTNQRAKIKQDVEEDILESIEHTRCQRRHTGEQRANKISKKTNQRAKNQQDVKKDILESKEQARCQRIHSREQSTNNMSRKTYQRAKSKPAQIAIEITFWSVCTHQVTIYVVSHLYQQIGTSVRSSNSSEDPPKVLNENSIFLLWKKTS